MHDIYGKLHLGTVCMLLQRQKMCLLTGYSTGDYNHKALQDQSYQSVTMFGLVDHRLWQRYAVICSAGVT